MNVSIGMKLLAVTAPVLWLGCCCSLIVWLPDVMSPGRWIEVRAITLPNGEELCVLQTWSSDFYTTVIACGTDSQFNTAFCIDGDDTKLWPWDVQAVLTKKEATLCLRPGRVFTYRWSSGQLMHGESVCEFDALDERDKDFLNLSTAWVRE